jgi:hypothetical protein
MAVAAAVVIGGGAAAAVILTHRTSPGHATPPPSTQSVTPSGSGTTPSATPSSTATSAPPGSPASSPQGTPTSTPNQVAAQNEANSVDSLLSSGATSSELLSEATTDAASCSSPVLAGDVNEIKQVRDQRQSELTQAQNLNVADLPNGASLRASLVSALGASLTADGDYLNWAKQQENPSTCVDGSSPAQIGADNDTALAAKNSFLNLWNPIAAQYSLQHRGPGDM